MSAITAVWANDLRNIVRDRTVSVLVVVPLIFVVLLRFGFPRLEAQVPAAADYAPILVGFFSTMAAVFPAFMQSFIMLEERDEGLFPVFGVLPIAAGRLLGYRLGVGTALSGVFALVVIVGSGLLSVPLARALGLATLCALGGPTFTLIVVSVADNKIEGLTVFKALFFVLGIAGLAAASEPAWTLIAGVIPSYWVYAAFVAEEATGRALAAAIAVALHAALIAWGFRHFSRHVR